MIKLKFKPFLPHQEKPERFEEFRKIASDVFKNLEGNLTFLYVSGINQFEILENTTDKKDFELKIMLGKYSNFLI